MRLSLALAASLGAACSLPPEEPVGQLELAWNLTLDGAPTDCDAVGAFTVETLTTTADSWFAYRWPCEDLAGVSGALPVGEQIVDVRVLSRTAQAIAMQPPVEIAIVAGATADLGSVTFAFASDPPETPEDCGEPGDEDGDGDADCDDLDCAGEPACDEDPPVCAPAVTIAVVYDGGGGVGAGFDQSFVVLHNRTAEPYDLAGHSLQLAGALLATWSKHDLPAESIPANGSYLIALGVAGLDGEPLPTPDETFADAVVSPDSLVVALQPDTTLLTACPTAPLDLFSADQAACAEGATVPAPGTAATEHYARGQAGCDDTDDNATDFTVELTSTPRTSASPPLVCDCPSAQGPSS